MTVQKGQRPEVPGRGDAAVGDLSRRYGSLLLRYFMRRGIHHADAEDLVQDVFQRLARKNALEGVASVEGYLFTMAANVARDQFRKDKVRRDNPVGELAEFVQVTETFSAERELGSRQELDRVLAALNAMPERMRTIFILARLENMPRAEIAGRLGMSKRSVELSLTQATACLAERRRMDP